MSIPLDRIFKVRYSGMLLNKQPSDSRSGGLSEWFLTKRPGARIGLVWSNLDLSYLTAISQIDPRVKDLDTNPPNREPPVDYMCATYVKTHVIYDWWNSCSFEYCGDKVFLIPTDLHLPGLDLWEIC